MNTSKRWIVDRATIARARAQDRLYVNDPEYFDFMNIYFANGECFRLPWACLLTYPPSSHHETRPKDFPPPTSHCNRHRLFQEILSQKRLF